ncbi:MAG: hypothetical protein A2W01_08075 [Candidatus Solincola sediminis]|uniref:Coenzyme A biosynthesis bifunctional protein CoaBC n=1 Tax=Candidatus Solincola sediminis TaxID=1797199 RepID=A0A1F2WSH2_9ACTN|nr:MAG: hypothetical protein A2Y75_04880 [Candidatus Solincola sediminis]OFW61616.1 MAG: hypothetical protein A2W01_08075 [Candidatus Solincola sediminis]
MSCIVVGVTGGIAAYKAVEIVRQLNLLGFQVKVIMTEHATRLVGPATFRAISGNPVALSLFEEEFGAMQHISLSHEADLIIVAPATANILAKMANGLADDLLSTTLLASRAPVLAAPAMNDYMYAHPATEANLKILKQRGVQIVGPGCGFLACGGKGEGRMAEPSEIVDAALEILGLYRKLDGVNVLVASGGTREPIDPVRFIGNRSSGKMGYALAEAAKGMGAEVLLISAPTTMEQPIGVERVMVETAEEMEKEVKTRAPHCKAIVMAAAVADFTPIEISGKKIKKLEKGGLYLELKHTPDILKELGENKPVGQILVGFAAETEDLLEHARQKLKGKNLDLIVANDVSREDSGFESDYNKAFLLFRDGREVELSLMPKRDLASLIWLEIAGLLERA